jgi:hypothetical protein
MDNQIRGFEKIRQPLSGYVMLVVILLLLMAVILTAKAIPDSPVLPIIFAVALIILAKGLTVINPNSSKLFLLFGAYRGSVRTSGLFWVNPFYTRMTLSLRARNFESEKVKVNDKLGNPIMISVILVWKVRDTYKSLFEVNDYVNWPPPIPMTISKMNERQSRSARTSMKSTVPWKRKYPSGSFLPASRWSRPVSPIWPMRRRSPIPC